MQLSNLTEKKYFVRYPNIVFYFDDFDQGLDHKEYRYVLPIQLRENAKLRNQAALGE